LLHTEATHCFSSQVDALVTDKHERARVYISAASVLSPASCSARA
jgi:hypothetical protein